MFQVFDNGVPADTAHCKVHHSWASSTFQTYEEALKYARMWIAPYGGSYDGSQGLDIELDKPCDYNGMGDIIEIRSVK